MDFGKRGGWNKRGGWKIFIKSINVEGGFLCGIGKRGLHVYQRDESTQYSMLYFDIKIG